MATGNIPLITLNNGVKIPQLGLGTWQAHDGGEVEAAVSSALANGYRLIDTAAVYGNEKGVGKALKQSGLKREELFITTKLWNSDQGPGAVGAFEKSLDRLQLDYIDLYLIHWPAPAADKFVETWKLLEKLYENKRIRAIGVSNFTPEHLEILMQQTSTIPAVNQIELHPHYQQAEAVAFCKQHGIKVEAYSPLGGAGGSVLQENIIKDIAVRHATSPAQIVLRWHMQNGTIAIPKATTAEHIKSNSEVFDFRLDPQDMANITKLETGQRRGPDPDSFNSGIKTGLVQLAHKFSLVHWQKEKK